MHCPVLNGCWPASGQCIVCPGCLVVTRCIAKYDALPSVEWMLASAGDGGTALLRHWVSVVLTRSGHRDQLEIVTNIE